MKTVTGKNILLPDIPTYEELLKCNIDQSLDLGNGIRRYLLEVLVCQPDMYPTQVNQFPESVRSWIQHTQEQYEHAFIQGDYDGDTEFAFWLEKLINRFRKKGFPVTITSRQKQAFARNREGIKTLKSYGGELFDMMWRIPLQEKVISPNAVIMLEEILPGAFRYLQLRGVAILQDNSKE